jgi:pimeloyl-ACP methyl ester carboxylesterase
VSVDTKQSAVTAETASRTVQTSRYKIHYYEAGEGHPVILLHGSGPGATGWSNFRPNIEPLSQHFHVRAVDMPGWGESQTQDDTTGRDHPADLIAFMDELGIERAALVGNSMGGMTSVATAVRYPDRVSHLVSMGAPAPGLDLFSASGLSEGLKVLFHAYREPTPENMKKLVQIMCFDPAWATDELAALRSAAALAHTEHLDSWNTFWESPQPPNPYFGLLPELAKLTVPTLALHGRDDRVVNYEHTLRFLSAIPTSRAHIINRCGHWLQIEHADEFNRIITDFVSTA